MQTPAHRAPAVVPTPAHTFELLDGKLVNRTAEEQQARVKAEADPAPGKPRRPPADAVPSTVGKEG